MTDQDNQLHDVLAAIRSESVSHKTLPIVTPEVYGRIRCKCSMCDVCRWFQRIEAHAFADAWSDTAQIPREAIGKPRFPSVEAALLRLCDLRDAGYGVPSVGGTLRAIHSLGVMVQAGKRAGAPSTSAAEDAVEVERALEYATQPEHSTTVASSVVLAKAVGHRIISKDSYGRSHRIAKKPSNEDIGQRFDMSTAEVSAMARRCLRRLRVEMAARGVVPEPRKSARLYLDVIRRREELCE